MLVLIATSLSSHIIPFYMFSKSAYISLQFFLRSASNLHRFIMLLLDPCFAKVCEINERCVALWDDKSKCGKLFTSDICVVVASMVLTLTKFVNFKNLTCIYL